MAVRLNGIDVGRSAATAGLRRERAPCIQGYARAADGNGQKLQARLVLLLAAAVHPAKICSRLLATTSPVRDNPRSRALQSISAARLRNGAAGETRVPAHVTGFGRFDLKGE